ncbi:unnamed protein product, partial [Laminaria digitata]
MGGGEGRGSRLTLDRKARERARSLRKIEKQHNKVGLRLRPPAAVLRMRNTGKAESGEFLRRFEMAYAQHALTRGIRTEHAQVGRRGRVGGGYLQTARRHTSRPAPRPRGWGR